MEGIDFTAFISGYLVEIFAAIIAGLIWKVGQRFGIEMDRRALLDGIEGKSRAVIAQYGAVTVDTGSSAVNDVVQYALDRFPKALRSLGIDANSLATIVETRLAAATLETKKRSLTHG